MRDHPLIFSAPMVRALIDGRKTQTRRVLNPQPTELHSEAWDYKGARWTGVAGCYCSTSGPSVLDVIKWRVGDRLWVKHAADVFSVYFKPILGWEGLYAAGTDGLIYRVDRSAPEPLKGSPTSKGYLSVALSNGTWHTKNVHKLVCETFYGPAPFEGAQVRHLNGDKIFNEPGNLCWGTQAENWSDRQAHGRGMGEDHFAAKLTREAVKKIRASGLSQRALAEKFGVSQSTIWSVKNSRGWRENYAIAPRTDNSFSLWRSPIFMPRWASRLTLTVMEVRVQRVGEISEADANAEGVEAVDTDTGGNFWHTSAKKIYAQLWDSIKGEGAFARNDWVAALSFNVDPRNIDASTNGAS